jgi:16S rRNA (cytosine1402-N4)-methyltransferase
VISFHSLEDRVVKQFITAASRPEAAYARLPLRESEMPQPVLMALARILPSDSEISENPRSRSAVLRVAERTYTPFGPEGAQAFMPPARRNVARSKKGAR